MKILVCISHVPDTTSKINFTDNNSKFDKNGVQFVINPNDEFGLTRAMWLKEKQGASVDVINVGLADSDATLRKALAIGADKAIRINMEPKNGLNVAKQIAHIVKSENYDLVIGGRESIDYNGGMVPGMIAGLTDYNFVDKCISVEINNEIITASREIEGGKEIVESKFPIVIAGQKGIVEESDLRIPNMRGIMMARRKELQIVDPIEAEDSTTTVNFEKPEPKSEVTLVSSDNVGELINLLHNEAKAI